MNVIPQPKRWTPRPGTYLPPPSQPGPAPALPDWARSETGNTGFGPASYVLRIDPVSGAHLLAQDEEGARYGRATLRQLAADPAGIPAGLIEDWPSFKVRGVSLDISRGRVPRLPALFDFAERLADLKVNHLQLYMEDSFRFPSHPGIGNPDGGLSPADIRALDGHCAALGIELTPSLASLGHLSKVLSLPAYRHLAEDLGTGTYPVPPATDLAQSSWQAGWTLSPGDPDGLAFLSSLYQDLLPNFRSARFNACLDEPFDLGFGRSRGRCAEIGLTQVYLQHLLAVKALAAERGKTELLVWGDMLLSHPEALDQLPKDVTVLDWHYDENADLSSFASLRERGLPVWACPSTNSWGCFFPRLSMARDNIRRTARAAAAAGAEGLLNTVWGDDGHFNPPGCEWHGLALGAECAWNPEADERFDERFCRRYLGRSDPATVAALARLGDLATLLQHGGRSSFWADCVFQPAASPFFRSEHPAYYAAERGKVVRDGRVLDRDRVGKAARGLAQARQSLAQAFASGDPMGLGPDWLLGIDALLLGAERWLALGPGGDATAAAALAERTRAVATRFAAGWRGRDHEPGLATVLRRFERSLEA